MLFDSERQQFMKMLLSSKMEIETFVQFKVGMMKDCSLSQKAREEGNKLFLQIPHTSEVHETIFSLYNKSIATAPDCSEELALGYGNRSAFLFHIEKYKDCIIDVDRAVKITKSCVLKVKLLCRKAKCLSIVKPSTVEDVLHEIKHMLDKILESNKNKKQLVKLFQEVSRTQTVNHQCLKVENLEKLNEKPSISESVEIKFNEKYGKHLVATRDFKPGEIIFVEKLYISCLDGKKILTHCNYCHTVCWSGIPCDNCSWVMFCSEECKKKAMKKYHDIECSINPPIQQICLNKIDIGIRLLIKGLKEVGSIEKLKFVLMHSGTNFEKERNTFFNIFNLASTGGDNAIEALSSVIPIAIMLTANNTSLFGKKFKLNKIEDIIKNDDLMFVGSLFIKLLKIVFTNSYHKSNLRSARSRYSGSCIALASSFINHSCLPNAARCFTKDREIIIFAILPIKKGSQIFLCYFGGICKDPIERRKMLRNWKFTCDCKACIENWSYKIEYPFNDLRELRIEMELNKVIHEMTWIVSKEFKPCDLKVIKKLSEAVIKAINYLPKSSPTPHILSFFLSEAYHRMNDFERNIYSSCM